MMNLEKRNFEIDSIEVINLAAKAIETELKKRSIFAKVSIKNNVATSEEFTTTPMLFERIYAESSFMKITKLNESDFVLDVEVHARYFLFDGGENGMKLFHFKSILTPRAERTLLVDWE